jgi:LacI family transcriptional regulator
MQVMQRSEGSSSTGKRRLIGIIADGATVSGRDIIHGATEYISAHRQWDVYGVLRRTWGRTTEWPPFDGAITAGLAPEVLHDICERSRYVVSCSSTTTSANVFTVCLDSTAVGTTGAEHLIECGLHHFSYYGVPDRPPSINRARSLAATVSQHALSYIPCPFAFSGLDQPAQGQPWIELTDWLKSLPKPIGIMAFDDSAGYYLAAACRHASINVPEQIAILGVNNDKLFCEIACTPLSSVDAGFTRIGFAAARLLDRLLRGEQVREHERIQRLPPMGVAKRLSTDLLAVNDPHVAEAVRFIREHACDPCSVDDVARSVAICRRRLEQRFAIRLGRTPGEEIMRIRMDTAKRLLRRHELRLKEIANLCGFSSDSAFARAFHHVVGTTPYDHRRAAQSTHLI